LKNSQLPAAKLKGFRRRYTSYETTDPTIDSQITSLQAAGADVLSVAASPKFAAQAIRKVHDLDWKPLFFMTYTSTSIASVINPAGPRTPSE
jgi:branched-chain amino acid transport system substrate-binding protein